MKIYTKTGDKGETSILGGVRVPKDDLRIEAIGSVDELNAHMGMLMDTLPNTIEISILSTIQEQLFIIGSYLASSNPNSSLPILDKSHISILEEHIDTWQKSLPAMTHFILPGGTISISQAHITRAVCRRAERTVIRLNKSIPVEDIITPYLNRLSDLLFVLARYIGQVMNVEEKKWIP